MPNYKEIARLKAAGQSNRAIADFLGLSRNTVNAAVARIEDSDLRRSVFNEVEKATLRPLPVRRYEMATYRTAIVQSNSHVAYQKNYYSVPYQYLGKEVTLKITSHHLTILCNKNVLSEHELLWNKIGAYSRCVSA